MPARLAHELSEVDERCRSAWCSKCACRVPVGANRPGGPLFCRMRQARNARQPHGMTLAEAELYKEGRPCEICGHLDNDLRRMHVDHDHASKSIRGVLCGSCNMAIGLFKDDPARLIAAVEYLRKHGR